MAKKRFKRTFLHVNLYTFCSLNVPQLERVKILIYKKRRHQKTRHMYKIYFLITEDTRNFGIAIDIPMYM